MGILKKFIPAVSMMVALMACSESSEREVAVIAPDDPAETADNGDVKNSNNNKGKDNRDTNSRDNKNSSDLQEPDNKDQNDDMEVKSRACAEGDVGCIGFISHESWDAPMGAQVRTWALTESGLKLVESDTLDKNGMFLANTSLKGYHLVDMQYEDVSAMRWIYFSENMEVGTYVAYWGMPALGFITNNGEGVEGVTVKILDKESKTDAAGAFEIDGLPHGVHLMNVEYQGESRTYFVQVADEDDKEPFVNRIDLSNGVYTLIDDFENWKSGRTYTGNMIWNGGTRYYVTDSVNGGGSRYKDKYIFAHAEKFKNDDMGYCMYLNVDIDESIDDHFAMAGLTFGSDESIFKSFNMSSATGLSFEAKGTTGVLIQLLVHNADGSSEYIQSPLMELTEEWKTYTYSFEGFASRLGDVSVIHFAVIADGQVYIDNVRLNGIKPGLWLSLGNEH